jgi:hypothetical protein
MHPLFVGREMSSIVSKKRFGSILAWLATNQRSRTWFVVGQAYQQLIRIFSHR